MMTAIGPPGHRRVPASLATASTLVASLVLLAGCGGGGGGGTVAPPADPLAAGWAAFEAGDYVQARAHFADARAANPGTAEPLTGLGWSLMSLSPDSLTAAVSRFGQAIAIDAGATDPLAGRAAAERALATRTIVTTTAGTHDSLAIASADAVLALALHWEFPHRSTIDWHDLRLIIAEASFARRDYARANLEVVNLGRTAVDPDAPGFADAFLSQLESLEDTLEGARPRGYAGYGGSAGH